MNRPGATLAAATLLALSPARAHADEEGVVPVAALEMARNGSGTAWQPASTPHAGLHAHAGGVDLMLHFFLFGGYDWQGGDRGDHQPFGIGWVMGMARKRFDNGSLMLRTMLSPEPWTIGYRDGGYPLLLQTGETFEGQPLHDRQHPHDLFMELGLLYTQGIGDRFALQLYAAPAGEPALGPVAFPHRYSASADPLAAIAHHWQDATHISFGVLTAGLIYRGVKLEGSWFNGREPDEERSDLDLRRFDSYSARLSLAPTPGWTGQVSWGHLASPETLHPEASAQRWTASAGYDHAVGARGHWAATAVLGVNKEIHESAAAAALLEVLVDLDGKNLLFGRGELVQKSGGDLVLAPALDEERFLVGALALGYLRNLGPFAGLVPGIGLRGAFNVVPEAVAPSYGGRVNVGGIVYARLAVAPF